MTLAIFTFTHMFLLWGIFALINLPLIYIKYKMVGKPLTISYLISTALSLHFFYTIYFVYFITKRGVESLWERYMPTSLQQKASSVYTKLTTFLSKEL